MPNLMANIDALMINALKLVLHCKCFTLIQRVGLSAWECRKSKWYFKTNKNALSL